MAGFGRLLRRRSRRASDEWTGRPPGAVAFADTHYECKRCGQFIFADTPTAHQLGGLVHYPRCWDPPDKRLTE